MVHGPESSHKVCTAQLNVPVLPPLPVASNTLPTAALHVIPWLCGWPWVPSRFYLHQCAIQHHAELNTFRAHVSIMLSGTQAGKWKMASKLPAKPCQLSI